MQSASTGISARCLPLCHIVIATDQPWIGPICRQRLKPPVLGVDDPTEWPCQVCIVMSDNLLCLQRRGIAAGMAIGNQYCVEPKVSCRTAGAVDTILGFHAGDDYPLNAKSL